jgi:hypothetical protein
VVSLGVSPPNRLVASAGDYTALNFHHFRDGTWGSLLDTPAAPSDSEAEYKRNMPQEVISDLGRPFTRLVVDSYLNSYTSLADVTRYLGLRAQQVGKVRELLTRG